MQIGVPQKNILTYGPEGQLHYRDLPQIADMIADLFAWHKAPVKPGSELSRILKAARDLGRRADIPLDISVDPQTLFDAHCCARLAASILALDFRPRYRQFFSDLQNGNLNFWNSEQSKAKDTEWELFLWSCLNRNMPNSAELLEPDILLHLPFRCIGIACKRAYSEGSVARQIEAGERQIRAGRIPGIVAISLDFIVDKEQSIYSHITTENVETLQHGTIDFFERIWQKIGPKISKKYLRKGRLLGLIFGLQSYVAFRDKPNSFIELIAMRFQNDVAGPNFSTQVMNYIHQALSMNSSGGLAGNFIAARLDSLKSLRPPMETSV